jgi:hypothetical protein
MLAAPLAADASTLTYTATGGGITGTLGGKGQKSLPARSGRSVAAAFAQRGVEFVEQGQASLGR